MKADINWDRMAAAMLDVRDSCRRIHELAKHVERDPNRPEIEQIKQLAAASSDRLRLALKHPR